MGVTGGATRFASTRRAALVVFVAAVGLARSAHAQSAASADPSLSQPSDSTFPWTISASPTSVRLGVDRSARLEIHGPDVPPSALDLRTSAGTVRDIVRTGPGSYTARYEPPTLRAPDVALVTVRSASEPTPAAAAIPLYGRYHLTVDVEPHAQVDIELADGTHQSAVAPASGRVDVMLHVAPGIDRARVQATDRGGNVTERVEQIEGIPLHRILLMRAPPPETQPRAARWFVIEADPSGQLTQSAPLGIEVTGALGVVTRRAPGVFEIRANPPRRAEPTTVAIRVAQPGTAMDTDHDEIVVPANEPVALEWQAPEHVRAGDEVSVLVTALDASREPVSGLADRLRVRVGDIDARIESQADAYRAVFRAPERVGDPELFARLTTDGNPPIEVRRLLHVDPGAPARLHVVAPALQVGTAREVGFVALDRYGNRTPLEHPTATVTGAAVRGVSRRRGALVLLLEPTDATARVYIEADYGLREHFVLRAAPVAEGRFTLLALGTLRTNFAAALFGGGRLSGTLRIPIDRAWDIDAMLDAGLEASDVHAPSGDHAVLFAVPIVLRMALTRRIGAVRLGIAAGGVLRVTSATAQFSNGEGASAIAVAPGAAVSAVLRWFSPAGVIALDVGAESGAIDTRSVRGTLGGLQVSLGWGFTL
jgi:hypothetical protein